MSLSGFSGGSRNPLISILLSILVLVAVYYLVSGLYNLLLYVSPILIIAAAVIDFPTVIQHGKNLIAGIQRDAVRGSLWLLANVVFFPITFIFLLFKALANRKMGKLREAFNQKGTTGNPIADGIFAAQQQQNPNTQHKASVPTATKPSNSNEEYIDFEELPPAKPTAEALPKTDRGNYGNSHEDFFK